MQHVIAWISQIGMTSIAFVLGVLVGVCIGFTIGAEPSRIDPDNNWRR